MLDKKLIRAMAEAERLMDKGEIPWVWAPGPEGIPERLAVSEEVMEDLELEIGQSVNSMVRDAILIINLEKLGEKLERLAQKVEDKQLSDNFDFRTMLGDDNVNDR
jgi:antitoxin component of MazEF toxin-antitoxin module